MRLPRVRFTPGAMMISVAVLGACMGLIALLARSSGMTPARLGVLLVAGVAFWSAALNVAAFSILWLIKRGGRAIARRICRKG